MKVVALRMLAAIALSAGEAGAHDERGHLEFEVGAGCPASTEFMAQVRARTERVRFVDATLDARELKVTAQSEGDHAVGGCASAPLRKTLQDPTSASEPRGIATGPDGNIWFTEMAGNKIGRYIP